MYFSKGGKKYSSSILIHILFISLFIYFKTMVLNMYKNKNKNSYFSTIHQIM